MATVALVACKFQDDPHNQKITHSAFQEYENNSTHLRDRLLLAAVRQLAGLAEDAGRARLLRAVHEGVDQQLISTIAETPVTLGGPSWPGVTT